jgi:hypothetical protein
MLTYEATYPTAQLARDWLVRLVSTRPRRASTLHASGQPAQVLATRSGRTQCEGAARKADSLGSGTHRNKDSN